ncbi:hypothetical protein ASF88_01360 [Leifsonia sp. Leaf336]|uniref:hypothetical protein n=1 Tax=Leifsonia sp. Leaf336 TaxID=1736341 RepID=UPI0006F9E115|nr:hypothetical protein [Leifsonia sp. Leaf336]KQR53550.1 hypothetical protein ASF88_01360 [Leifsonia sp. Leaf336]
MRTSTLVPVVAGLVALAGVALAAGPTYSAGAGVDAGMAPSLDLVTIDSRGIVNRSHGDAAFLPLGDDDRYAPGRAFHLNVGVADNDPDTGAAVTLAVLPMDVAGTGQVGASPNLTPFLLVTVVDETTGQVLVGGSATDPSRGVEVADASSLLNRLEPRDADPLPEGSRWIPGASGNRHDLDVTIYCPDTPAVRALANGRSDLDLMVYGTGAPSPH